MKKNIKLVAAIAIIIVFALPIVTIGSRFYNVEILARGYVSALPLTTDRPGYGGISTVTFSDTRIDNLVGLLYSSFYATYPKWTNNTAWVPPQLFPAHKVNFTIIATFKSVGFTGVFSSPVLSIRDTKEYNVNATIAANQIPPGTYFVVVSLQINGVPNPPLANNFTLTLP
ncbi:MAG TPA: hypothetical protein VGS11_04205 [Candidatus Bathyarchaeia archaeon]|nr:hypothetical protein [Candidatus Bathyarchaeia archaeon]